MSTTTSDKNSRRKSEDVRRVALDVGRRFLTTGGPSALTLKAVGAEMGMSHANLIHHFGSAEAFQTELKAMMVSELTRTVTALVERGGTADVGALVDLVFDAYAVGGIGTLMAWSALTPTGPAVDGPLQAVGELVAVLEPQIEGHAKAQRARAMIALVTSLALADSLIGRDLAKIGGGDRRAMRDLAVQLLLELATRPDIGVGPAAGGRSLEAQLSATAGTR